MALRSKRRPLDAQEAAHRRRAGIDARKAMAQRGEVPRFTVRAARVADLGFITDAWLHSYKSSPVTCHISDDIYRIEQRDRIRRIVPRSKVLCAVDEDDDTRVKAWMVFELPWRARRYIILHYVSVHPSLQNMGLGSQFVALARTTGADPAAPMWASHYTYAMKRLLCRWNLIYNPYLLEAPVEPESRPPR